MSKRIIGFGGAMIVACATVASAQVAGGEQLVASGYNRFIQDSRSAADGLRGTMQLMAISLLEADPRFANGFLYGLHRDVGAHLRDYRSYRGAFGKGSLHIVIDTVTGAFMAHVDWHNPYQDVANLLGHALGEVVPHFFEAFFHGFARSSPPPRQLPPVGADDAARP